MVLAKPSSSTDNPNEVLQMERSSILSNKDSKSDPSRSRTFQLPNFRAGDADYSLQSLASGYDYTYCVTPSSRNSDNATHSSK